MTSACYQLDIAKLKRAGSRVRSSHEAVAEQKLPDLARRGQRKAVHKFPEAWRLVRRQMLAAEREELI
jgi:hypothetical protein